MRKNSSCLVRQASVGDLELLVPLFDAYRQFYRQAADLDLARRFLSQRLDRHESVILLALENGSSAVGFTQLFPSFSSVSAARILVLNDLFVAPEARRHKVASLLLRASAEFGRKAGAVRLALRTEINNHAAQALYEAEGWTRDLMFYSYDLPLTPRPS